MGLLVWADSIGELLLPGGAEAEDPAMAEMFRLGTFALGVYFLVGALPYLLLSGMGTTEALIRFGGAWANALPSWQRGVAGQVYRAYAIRAVSGGLAAAASLVGGRLLARWVAARWRAGAGWSLAGALGTGFALLALFTAGRTAVALPYELAKLALPIGQVSSGMPPGSAMTWQYVTAALRVLQGLLLLALCGGAGRWLARGAPQSPRPVLGALRKEGTMSAALCGAILWGMLLEVDWLRGFGLEGTVHAFGPAARWAIAGAAPVLALAAMVAAGRWVPGAARAAADGTAAGQSDGGATLAAIEVAVTAVAIEQLFGAGWQRKDALYSGLPVLVTILLAMALRGDVARWCVRGAADLGDLRERRRAALYPCLSFIGVVMVLGHARIALLSVLVSTGVLTPQPAQAPYFGGHSIGALLPYVQLAAALVLLLGRRPLSRLLAYGPLLHRRVREVAASAGE